MAGGLGVWARRGDPERSAAERVDPEAFEGVGDVGRSGEGRAGGTVEGRLGCVGVRSMSDVVGVDGMDRVAMSRITLVTCPDLIFRVRATAGSRRRMLYRPVNRVFAARLYSKRSLKEDPAFLQVLSPLESFTRRLIDSSAAGDAKYGHRDGIQLWSTIPQVAKPTQDVPSMEKARFIDRESQPDVELLHDGFIHEDYPPGTFVEIRRWMVFFSRIIAADIS